MRQLLMLKLRRQIITTAVRCSTISLLKTRATLLLRALNGKNSTSPTVMNMLMQTAILTKWTNSEQHLSYLKSVIEDVASTGANASVSVHEVKYFLEKYYEKFPEEGGAYVFYIQDKDGNPISGATVELNSEFTRTSDIRLCS